MNKALGYFIEPGIKRLRIEGELKAVPIFALVSVTESGRRLLKYYFDKGTAEKRRDKLIKRMENQIV